MNSWALASQSDSYVTVPMASAMVRAIGSAGFARDVLMAVRPYFESAYCSIFSIRQSGETQVVDVGGLEPKLDGSRPAKRYMELKFYVQDRLHDVADGLAGTRMLTLQSVSDIPTEAYRVDCYQSLGLHQRCSLVFREDGGMLTALNFYRLKQDSIYSSAELDFIKASATLLCSVAERHMALQGAVSAPAKRAEALFNEAGLSKREQSVLLHALNGLSNKEIARQLGLEASTVATYRERAYRRLGMSRHTDLVKHLLHGDAV